MDLDAFYNSEFEQHQITLNNTRHQLLDYFSRLIKISANAVREGNKLLFFGNGGSAGDCQHIAAELVVRYTSERDPIAAIALTTDTSVLTAIANDRSFNDLFARQLDAIGQPGDVAIAISTSGMSKNILRGLEMARRKNLITIGFRGHSGGKMAELIPATKSSVDY